MSRFNRALQFGSVLQAAVAAAVAAVMHTAIAVRNANVRKVKQLLRILFRNRRCELAAGAELQLARLFHHCGGNFANPMTDEVDRCGSGEIKISLPAFVPDVHFFSAHRRRKSFSERTSKERGAGISLTCAGIGHDSDYVAT